ncbi:MAG: hypothetical protein HRT73_13470, partial [Flavobacteriales bacterium]|nr:hypothetical protein [Flavobacteriales bacterium]
MNIKLCLLKKYLFLLTTLLILALSNDINATNKYWVGSFSNNWNDPLNWSLTTGGIPGTSPASSIDVAIFDGNGNINCNINTNIDILGLSIDLGYSSTIIQNNGKTITIGNSNFSQADGVFIGGNQSIDINGNYYLLGGVFTSTSGTMFIGQTIDSDITIFDHQTGTFNHNNGTVEFNPTCTNWATRTYTIDVNSSTLFNHVILDANSSASGDEKFATPVNDTVQCVGNLTHDDGSVNGIFATQQNLIINAEATEGTGWFILNGTTNQTYTITTGTPKTCGIAINKNTGSVTPNATTNFNCSQFKQIKGDFTCPSGVMKIGHNYNGNITIFDHQTGVF